MPNTTAWAASSQALLVISTATRTAADNAAAKRSPRGSTFMGMLLLPRPCFVHAQSTWRGLNLLPHHGVPGAPDAGLRSGRGQSGGAIAAGGRTQRGRHAAVVDLTPPGEHGRPQPSLG